MIARAIDPSAAGNRGLINAKKMRLRRECALIQHFLSVLITPESSIQFRLKRKEYVYTLEEDETIEIRCGLVLYELFLSIMYPETSVNVDDLKNKMRAVTLAGCSYNLKAYFTEIEDYRLKIKAEKDRA